MKYPVKVCYRGYLIEINLQPSGYSYLIQVILQSSDMRRLLDDIEVESFNRYCPLSIHGLENAIDEAQQEIGEWWDKHQSQVDEWSDDHAFTDRELVADRRWG